MPILVRWRALHTELEPRSIVSIKIVGLRLLGEGGSEEFRGGDLSPYPPASRWLNP